MKDVKKIKTGTHLKLDHRIIGIPKFMSMNSTVYKLLTGFKLRNIVLFIKDGASVSVKGKQAVKL